MKKQGFVGCLLNPDPGECNGIETPPLGDRFWYPLYEKLVELDVPGHIHSTGCRSERLPYSLHFINEENIAIVSLLNSPVFTDFPTLKILVSHGGGAIPYQYARFEASSLRGKGPRFSDQMRKLYYDTVLYSKDALELLFKTVGVDRCLFGTERPGVGTVKDPKTGRWLDETRFTIEAIDWLSGGGQEDDLRGQREESLQPESDRAGGGLRKDSVMATRPVRRRLVLCGCDPDPRVRGGGAGAAAAEDHHQLPDAQRRIVADVHREGRRLLPEVRPRRRSRSSACIRPASRC